MYTRSKALFLTSLTLILVVGFALRTIEYSAFASLWLDELFIALNVTAREWGELLTEPLRYHQVAPIGFLIAIKLGTVILGPGEAGLRLFPYLASLAGLVLFWRVSARFLSPSTLVAAVAIFALSPTLLWYSRNVKQYSGDVAVVLLLVLLALRSREDRGEKTRHAAAVGLLGGAAILCSQPAVVVAFVLLGMLFIQRLRSGRPMRPFVYLMVGWLAASLVVVGTSLVLSPLETREFMQHGWSKRGFVPWGPEAVGVLLLTALFFHRLRSGKSLRPFVYLMVGWVAMSLMIIVIATFLNPLQTNLYLRQASKTQVFLPRALDAVVWLPVRVFLLMGLFVGRFLPDTGPEALVAGFFTLLAAIGLQWLVRRQRGTASLLYSPAVGGILASAAGILPLSGRVSLYLCPVLLVSALAGIDQIRVWIPARLKVIPALILVALVAVPIAVLIVVPIPARREEARPVLEEVRSRWRPEDIIYVIPGGGRAMEFYGPPLGLRWKQVQIEKGNHRAGLYQVDTMRGRSRSWIFYTHAIPCEQQLIRSYLETIGVEVDRIADPFGLEGKSEAAAYLYDLSDPARLSRASASTFPVPEIIAEDCGYPAGLDELRLRL